MAKKTLLGIDIGYESLKLALVAGDKVKKTVVIPMPDKLLKEGNVVSIEAMGSLIRDAMKEHRLSAKYAAFILSSENVYIRNVTMPVMTEEQLIYNLPYEFQDYITDELKNYQYDYAMITPHDQLLASLSDHMDAIEEKEGAEEENTSKTMELMAVAVKKSVIEDARQIVRKAGMKLQVAAPVISAYSALIRTHQENTNFEMKEYCIVDLGYESIRMYMFKGDCHMVTRILETGMSRVDEAVSDAFNVDIHLAHSYVKTNHENCLNGEVCMDSFMGISVELMRALNFYRFSNPDSELEDIFFCGGGANMKPFRELLMESLEMNVHLMRELLADGEKIEECERVSEAIGITQN